MFHWGTNNVKMPPKLKNTGKGRGGGGGGELVAVALLFRAKRTQGHKEGEQEKTRKRKEQKKKRKRRGKQFENKSRSNKKNVLKDEEIRKRCRLRQGRSAPIVTFFEAPFSLEVIVCSIVLVLLLIVYLGPKPDPVRKK